MKQSARLLTIAAVLLLKTNFFAQTTPPGDVVPVGDTQFRFGQPTNLQALNSAFYDDASSVTADGLTIFIDSERPGGVGATDIWIAARPTPSSPWGDPFNAGRLINSESYDVAPAVSPDGLDLYFSSDRGGNMDIWVASRTTPADAFGQPVNLGDAINKAQEDFGACSSADGLTLLFSSIDRPGGLGGGDIWMSTRATRAAAWEPARNLGGPVNTASFELFPCLSLDGLLLFFMSSRTSEPNGNIWVSKRATTVSPFGSPVRVGPIGPTSFRARPHALSADGGTLYYGSFEREGGLGDWDLWQISITALPRLQSVGVTRQGGSSQFRFDLLGRTGTGYRVEASTDLRSWVPWLTTNTTDRLRLDDSIPQGRSQGFYRAVVP